MVERKTVKLSMRISPRLFQMIDELSPLFGYNESAVVDHILKWYENSQDHQEQLLKLSRARFVALYRDWEIRERQKELKEPQEKKLEE